MQVNDTRTLSPAAQEELRRRVVAAIRDQGMRKNSAARVFRVSRTSIDAWLKAYRRKGEGGLASGQRGRPPEPRLSKVQSAQARRLIRDRCPDQLKLPFALWTRAAVGELLEERFQLKVSVWTVGRYLKAWNFTPQKPLRRAYEQDPAAVQRWLTVQYPAIQARAKRENALIHWGDEMGLRSDHQAGTSYGIRGHTPVIPGTGKRFGCNMISAITNRGQLSFMLFKQSFTNSMFRKFLGRLIRQPYLQGRKCFLIVDGHPVHKSAGVRTWLARHCQRIELFLLPGYSPELNPDELLNQDTKTNALGRQRPETQKQMIHLVHTHLHSTQREPEIVQHYFFEEHVRYAADPVLFNNYRSP
jgi:transposase